MKEKKIILILVKTVREALFRAVVIGVKTITIGEISGSTLNATRTNEDL